MIDKMKITAKTVEEAIKKAADIWKIDAVKNGYTVIQEPSRGIFGLGSKDAIIEVNKNVPNVSVAEKQEAQEQEAPKQAKAEAKKPAAKPAQPQASEKAVKTE